MKGAAYPRRPPPLALEEKMLMTRFLRRIIWATILCCAAADRPVSGGTARFDIVGDLPGGPRRSESGGVSADGQFVAATGFVGPDLEVEAFRWTLTGGPEPVGTLPADGSNSLALGISPDGGVVVGRNNSVNRIEAFRWTPSQGIQPLGYLRRQDASSQASDTSQGGAVIVGSSGSLETQREEAFRWTAAGGMTGLGFLPGGADTSVATGVSADGAVVVGSSGSADQGFQAFRWTESGGMVGLGTLPGAQDSTAAGVSADARVIVGSSGGEAFRWTAEGGMVSIADPGDGAAAALAWAASADGSVIVGESDNRAFVWDDAHGFRDLTTLLDEAGLLGAFPDAVLTRAKDVSADGTVIVGDGFGLGGNDPLVWRVTLSRDGTVIPLPPAVWAGAGGLAMLFVTSYIGFGPRCRRRAPLLMH